MIAAPATHRTGIADAGAVFLAALIVRFVFAMSVAAAPVIADAADYDRLAHALNDGLGYAALDGTPTSERPPLYAYTLAFLYNLFGDGQGPMLALQVIVDAGTCVLVFLLAFRHFGRQAALAAAAMAILSLSLLFATRFLLTETFAAFLLIATMYALDIAIERWGWRAFFVTGALVGLSTLTKGTTLALPAALMVPVALASQWAWGRIVRAGALIALGFVLVLLPWTIRNYRVHGEFVPVATQMGWVIYSSYTPPQGKIMGVYTTDDTVIAARALPEAERSRTLLRAAIQRIRERPSDVPRLVVLKFLYFVMPFDWEMLNGDGVFNFTYALSVPLALYGFWVSRSTGWRVALLASAPLFFLVLSLALYGSPRIRLPIEPLLMVAAGGGLASAWQRAGAYRPALGTALATAVLIGFTAYRFSAEMKRLGAQSLRVLGLW